jgi:hypothetical protein
MSLFQKWRDRKENGFCLGIGTNGGGGGYKKRVKESQYEKMRLVECILRMRGGENKGE